MPGTTELGLKLGLSCHHETLPGGDTKRACMYGMHLEGEWYQYLYWVIRATLDRHGNPENSQQVYVLMYLGSSLMGDRITCHLQKKVHPPYYGVQDFSWPNYGSHFNPILPLTPVDLPADPKTCQKSASGPLPGTQISMGSLLLFL